VPGTSSSTYSNIKAPVAGMQAIPFLFFHHTYPSVLPTMPNTKIKTQTPAPISYLNYFLYIYFAVALAPAISIRIEL